MWRAFRLSAAAAREGANEGEVGELRTAAAQRLAALEAGVAAAVDAAAVRYGGMGADLAAHASRAGADLAALQACTSTAFCPVSYAWCPVMVA